MAGIGARNTGAGSGAATCGIGFRIGALGAAMPGLANVPNRAAAAADKPLAPIVIATAARPATRVFLRHMVRLRVSIHLPVTNMGLETRARKAAHASATKDR